jgi:DNA-directed RNA polymerase specialized sigma24 family protein
MGMSVQKRTGRSCATGIYRGQFPPQLPPDPGEEAGDEPPLRVRGDELDLYGEFHFELRKTVASRVRASWEVIEDACSFAWVEFFRYQPDRDRNWKGWLVTVAKREAWRQNALELKEREAVRGEDLPIDPVDPRDRHGEVLEFRRRLMSSRSFHRCCRRWW